MQRKKQTKKNTKSTQIEYIRLVDKNTLYSFTLYIADRDTETDKNVCKMVLGSEKLNQQV